MELQLEAMGLTFPDLVKRCAEHSERMGVEIMFDRTCVIERSVVTTYGRCGRCWYCVAVVMKLEKRFVGDGVFPDEPLEA